MSLEKSSVDISFNDKATLERIAKGRRGSIARPVKMRSHIILPVRTLHPRE